MQDGNVTLVFGRGGVGRVSVQEWVAQWGVLAEHDPQSCVKTLFLLGFDGRPDRGLVATYPSLCEGVLYRMLQWGNQEQRDYVTLAVLSPSAAALESLAASIGMPADSLGASTTLVAASAADIGVVYKLVAAIDSHTMPSALASDSDAVLIVLRDDVAGELEDALRLDSVLPPSALRLFLFICGTDASDAISAARRRNHIEAEGRLRGRCVRSMSHSNGRRELEEATSSLLQRLSRLRRNQRALIQGLCVAALSVTAAVVGLLAFNVVESGRKASSKRGK